MDIDMHRQTLRGTMDSTQFFGGEPSLEDDKDGYGRYMLDADGKGKAPYTRATTIAKMLDSGKGLEIWSQRKVAKGVAQSPALVARAAVTPLDDKQAWREILDQAEVKSGGDEKRDLGSAFHALHEHVETMSDDEWLAVPADLQATYTKYRAELDRVGITEVMTEVTVVNTQLGTAGKADAIFRLADGRLVIGDRKSGRVAEYPHSAAVQLAIYANADVLLTFNPDGSVERHPMPELDLTTAIVIDVKIGDATTASVHAYEIDIWAGWAAALLSAKIRRWRNRRDLITPYHPEFPPADKARNAAAVELTKVAQHIPVSRELVAELVPGTGVPLGHAAGSVYTDGQTGGYHATPEERAAFAAELPPPSTGFPTEVAHGPAANAGAGMSPVAKAVLGTGPAIGTGNAIQPPHAGTHPAWSSKDQAVIALDSKGDRVGTEPVPGPQDQPVAGGPGGVQTVAERQVDVDALLAAFVADVDALLAAFKTKAALQGVLSAVNPGANLARTRANLAKDIVSHPSWPSRRASYLPHDHNDAGTVLTPEETAAEGEAFSATVSNAPGPVPPDPEPGYAATGQSDSEAFTNSQNTGDPYVQGPPRPAADNPFAQPAAVVPTLSVEDQVLQQIGEATSHRDLEMAWETANRAGIGWPPRLHKAATIRQDQLTSAPAAQ